MEFLRLNLHLAIELGDSRVGQGFLGVRATSQDGQSKFAFQILSRHGLWDSCVGLGTTIPRVELSKGHVLSSHDSSGDISCSSLELSIIHLGAVSLKSLDILDKTRDGVLLPWLCCHSELIATRRCEIRLPLVHNIVKLCGDSLAVFKR